MATVNPSYTRIFDMLKVIEISSSHQRYPLTFSVHGRAVDPHFTFRLQFAENRVGVIKVEPLEPGEVNLAEEVIRTQRNTILPEDVSAAFEQLNVLEVYPTIVDVTTAIFAGLRQMQVSSPVFTLNRATDEHNRLVYILGLAAYVVDDSFMPVSRVTMTIEVRPMSSFEKTAVALKKQRAKNAEEGLPEPVLKTTERGPMADQMVEIVERIADDLDGKPAGTAEAVAELNQLANGLPVSDLNSVSMAEQVEGTEPRGYRVRDLTPQRVGMGRPASTGAAKLPGAVEATVSEYAEGLDPNVAMAGEYRDGSEVPLPEGMVQKVAVLTGSDGHRNLPGMHASLTAACMTGRVSMAEPHMSGAMLNNKHNPKD